MGVVEIGLERAAGCPMQASGPDPRKTVKIARAHQEKAEEAVLISDATAARAILRSEKFNQAGMSAEMKQIINVGRRPVIVMDGPEHRRLRTATARFFTPKIVTTRYLDLMERTAAELVAKLHAEGGGDLSKIAMEMATAIAADIVGLTESKPTDLAVRLMRLIGGGSGKPMGPIRLLAQNLQSFWQLAMFELHDVRPAVAARKKQRKEDVVSHLLDEGYKLREIVAECVTYGAAGMVTTKEFIVVAFWHMMENEELRARFIAADRKAQVLILEEVLRLEPIVGVLLRRSTAEVEVPGVPGGPSPAGTLFHIDVRDANADQDAVGECPLAIDPGREVAKRPGGSMFAFGDGVHRCPGHQVAMYESAIFLEALFKLPGLRIVSGPDIGWVPVLFGFEFFKFMIACDRK